MLPGNGTFAVTIPLYDEHQTRDTTHRKHRDGLENIGTVSLHHVSTVTREVLTAIKISRKSRSLKFVLTAVRH